MVWDPFCTTSAESQVLPMSARMLGLPASQHQIRIRETVVCPKSCILKLQSREVVSLSIWDARGFQGHCMSCFFSLEGTCREQKEILCPEVLKSAPGRLKCETQRMELQGAIQCSGKVLDLSGHPGSCWRCSHARCLSDARSKPHNARC